VTQVPVPDYCMTCARELPKGVLRYCNSRCEAKFYADMGWTGMLATKSEVGVIVCPVCHRTLQGMKTHCYKCSWKL
jgi:hypothetical protein